MTTEQLERGNLGVPGRDAAVRAGFVLVAQCEALEAGIYGLVGMPLTHEEKRRAAYER
jgi:hypothetical protein